MHTNNPNGSDASVSLTALDQLAHDTDPEIVPQLITVFLNDAKQRIDHITDAIESRDYPTIAAEAHALGSSAATFGLPGVHTAARQCEQALREANHNNGLTYAQDIVTNATLGLEALQNYARERH